MRGLWCLALAACFFTASARVVDDQQAPLTTEQPSRRPKSSRFASLIVRPSEDEYQPLMCAALRAGGTRGAAGAGCAVPDEHRLQGPL